jgi:S-formylglutathione hydrolase
VKVIENTKIHGGVHKVVEHWSETNKCMMKFAIFLPHEGVKDQRVHYPVLYFLSGLTCTHENIPMKTNYAEHA